MLQYSNQQKHMMFGLTGPPSIITTESQIANYLETACSVVRGYLIVGTFSGKGPKKCSGLDVKRYNEEQLRLLLSRGFRKIKCITEDHITPFNTSQSFLFCSFKRQ